jgi:hypothetical protein
MTLHRLLRASGSQPGRCLGGGRAPRRVTRELAGRAAALEALARASGWVRTGWARPRLRTTPLWGLALADVVAAERPAGGLEDRPAGRRPTPRTAGDRAPVARWPEPELAPAKAAKAPRSAEARPPGPERAPTRDLAAPRRAEARASGRQPARARGLAGPGGSGGRPGRRRAPAVELPDLPKRTPTGLLERLAGATARRSIPLPPPRPPAAAHSLPPARSAAASRRPSPDRSPAASRLRLSARPPAVPRSLPSARSSAAPGPRPGGQPGWGERLAGRVRWRLEEPAAASLRPRRRAGASRETTAAALERPPGGAPAASPEPARPGGGDRSRAERPRNEVWAARLDGTPAPEELLLRLARFGEGGRPAAGGEAPARPRQEAPAPDQADLGALADPAASGAAVGSDGPAHDLGGSRREMHGSPPPTPQPDGLGLGRRTPEAPDRWPSGARLPGAGRNDPSPEDRFAPSLSSELPRRALGGPDLGRNERGIPGTFGRAPADEEPDESELRRLARSLERLLGDEARRFGIEV